MEVDFLGQGWSFPVQLDKNGQFKLVTDEESIRQSILLILSTSKGERLMRPNFGCSIQSLVFERNNSETRARIQLAIQEALEEFEPRIELLDVIVESNSKALNKLEIEIRYRVLTSNVKHNLVYPFYLGGD